jgi:hypothetical protein
LCASAMAAWFCRHNSEMGSWPTRNVRAAPSVALGILAIVGGSSICTRSKLNVGPDRAFGIGRPVCGSLEFYVT